MEISRDKYLNDLIVRKGNGMIKVITGIRRCGKTYLVFELFVRHLLESGVPRDHIVSLALDDRANACYRDPDALYEYLLNRIGEDDGTYYVLLDEIQYAISTRELKGKDEPPALYGVLNGLLRRRNVDVYTLFDAVVCAKEVGCGKDRPDIYLEAARRISAQPKGCMVFEDLLQGICSAKRAGMRTCAVLSDNPLQNAREVVDTADCAIASWREALGDDKR